MKEILTTGGKGGCGKTSVRASFAGPAGDAAPEDRGGDAPGPDPRLERP